MPKTVQDVLTIFRNVTGRTDIQDPMFTDEIMIGYLNDFYQLIMGQEVRLFENKSWYEFNMTIGQSDYDVDTQATASTSTSGTSILRPPAYADGYWIAWYQDPKIFFNIWPETQVYDQARPTYVLYYDRKLIFRQPPDQAYHIKIANYTINPAINNVGGEIAQDYWFRYIAYGAAIDLLNDYNELDRANNLMGAFNRYKNLVQARTYTQNTEQRAAPSF